MLQIVIRRRTVHDLGIRGKAVALALGRAGSNDGAVGVDDRLGEAGRPRGQEEDGFLIRLGLVDSKFCIRGLGSSLDLGEQVDVETGNGLELVSAALVGQPDGGREEVLDVVDVTLLVGLLSTQGGLQARDVAGKETGPDSGHVVLVLSEVNNDDRAGRLSPGTEGLGEGEGILGELAKGLCLDRRVMGRGCDEAQLVVGVLGHGPREDVEEGPGGRRSLQVIAGVNRGGSGNSDGGHEECSRYTRGGDVSR